LLLFLFKEANFSFFFLSFLRQKALAAYRYIGRHQDELSFEEGDSVKVIEEYSDGWSKGMLLVPDKPAAIGLFPGTYVKKVIRHRILSY